MKIYAIDHVQIAMPPEEEDLARAFYGGILELTEIPKPPELAKRGGVWFEHRAVKIHLGVEQDFRPAKKAHPALLVDDLDTLVKRCQEAGYQVDADQPPLEGYNRVHIHDSFGNRIEFMETTSSLKDPQMVMKKLEEIRLETLRRLENLTQEQLDTRPPQAEGEEAWSLGEVFMHLAIDEFYLRELIARPLLEGIKPPDGIRFLPPPPAYGTPKAAIRFWFERARLQTRRYFDDWPGNANLDLTHAGGLEAMNGLEWFEGYAGHEAFHHQQIDRLIVQVAQSAQK